MLSLDKKYLFVVPRRLPLHEMTSENCFLKKSKFLAVEHFDFNGINQNANNTTKLTLNQRYI